MASTGVPGLSETPAFLPGAYQLDRAMTMRAGLGMER